jgi:hypothetical protein
MANKLRAQISLQPFWRNSRWYADLYGNPVGNAEVEVMLPNGISTDRFGSTKDLRKIAKFVLETENKR